MTDVDPNLFGLPGAEHMRNDEVDVYEADIDGRTTGNPEEVWIIEEWTCGSVRFGSNTAECMAEDAGEKLCDDLEFDEDGADAIGRAAAHPDVVAAFQEALDLLAKKVNYRMADKKVADHRVTFDADDEPLLDGEPMYRTVEAS
jgi:hypothetical protein